MWLRLLTATDITDMFRVRREGIYEWMWHHSFPRGVKVGGRTMWRNDDLALFLAPYPDAAWRYGLDEPIEPFPVALSRKELLTVIKVDYQSLWRWCKTGQFPAPFHIRHRPYWGGPELQKWIDNLNEYELPPERQARERVEEGVAGAAADYEALLAATDPWHHPTPRRNSPGPWTLAAPTHAIPARKTFAAIGGSTGRHLTVVG